MKRTNIVLSILAILALITIFAVASYAFIHLGNFNVTNVSNLTATSERNNMVFDSLGGVMELNVTAGNMSNALSGNVAAENTAILTVNFQANTSYSVVCNYDIIYEWTSTDKYQAHTTGVTENEYTIQASLASNEHVYEGDNLISSDTDLADIVGNQTSAVVVSGAQIEGTSSTTSTAVWTMTSKFFNVDASQDVLSGKAYSGRFKVANVSCGPGTRIRTLVEYISNEAPRSGTDAVSNSPWILTSDRPGEYRYAGKNPDNYVQFNGELWRIIGVMPDMEYCTGMYGPDHECDTTTTGSLVKIIRNQTISSSTLRWDYKQSGVGSSTSNYGSNDWSDSQMMLMLNGPNYLKTGYDVNGNRLHVSYTISNSAVKDNGSHSFYNAYNSYLEGSGTNIYIPSSATTSSYTATNGTVYNKIGALSKIATVKWDLYGTNSYGTAAEGSPAAFYNKERNIGNAGAVYNVTATGREKRAVYWYGKIGLMYPSDYGYATNGGSTYNRSTCLGFQINGWSSGIYKTDCAGGSFLWYNNITSTAPGTSGTSQLTLSPHSGYAYSAFYVNNNGNLSNANAYIGNYVRPVLYLNADTLFTGGTGKWNDPYTIVSLGNLKNQNISKTYWFAPSREYTYPNYGGTLQSNGVETGYNAYIGQDNKKYYVCATTSGHELCLTQPYTQYGLSSHTLNADFSPSPQVSAKQALYQAFIDAGIDANYASCGQDTSTVSCEADNFECSITRSGDVKCTDNTGHVTCSVYANGHAYCYSS